MKITAQLVAAALSAASAFAADSHPVSPLWPGGAPGSESRKDEPEKVVGNASPAGAPGTFSVLALT